VFAIFAFDNVDFETIVEQLVHPGFLDASKVTYESAYDIRQVSVEPDGLLVL